MQNIRVKIQTGQQCMVLSLKMLLHWAHFKIDYLVRAKYNRYLIIKSHLNPLSAS